MIRATIYLKNGQTIVVHATNCEYKSIGNELSEFSTIGSPDYPLYLRLDDVSAITIERKTLFGWRASQ